MNNLKIDDMPHGKANQELQKLEDNICLNALEKAKVEEMLVEEMFGWVEITDEQILLTQKICDLYLKFAKELIDIVPFGSYRDDALKALLVSEHHSLDAIVVKE